MVILFDRHYNDAMEYAQLDITRERAIEFIKDDVLWFCCEDDDQEFETKYLNEFIKTYNYFKDLVDKGIKF